MSPPYLPEAVSLRLRYGRVLTKAGHFQGRIHRGSGNSPSLPARWEFQESAVVLATVAKATGSYADKQDASGFSGEGSDVSPFLLAVLCASQGASV